MQRLADLFAPLASVIPAAGMALLVIFLLFLVQRAVRRRESQTRDLQFRGQLLLIGLSLAGIVLVILAAPLSETTKGQLLGLLGLLVSAAITLSSTTLIGNAMAGLMLRGSRAFRAGDFLEVEGHFGRVAARGLLQTQIQNELRDLVSLPNLYLVTHPLTVIRSDSTIVSATVSLGYDLPREEVGRALEQAVEAAGLREPFVHVLELGDFSITYRAAGLLTEVKRLVSARSDLRKSMVDALHGAGLEIVSPTFMNTRAYAPEHAFRPQGATRPGPAKPREPRFEDLAFDKADEAESLENLKEAQRGLQEKLEDLRQQKKKASGAEADALAERVKRLERREGQLAELIRQRLEAGD